MRFVHTSDLHIGKTVHGFSMLDDQRYILEQIAGIIADEEADGLIIAGDVYDRNVPPEAAVDLFDRFITGLSGTGCKIYVIAGNHDSAERLAFGHELLCKQGVHITDTYSGKMERISGHDDRGDINIYLLPYIKPSIVRPFFPDMDIRTPDDAMSATIDATDIDHAARNILIAHQFIVGRGIELKTSESEESVFTVGGVDCISSNLLESFDYVALGHIHKPQHAGRTTVRYSGSPLKYSLSEAYDDKGVSVVDIADKGDIRVKHVSLTPKRDVREIRGTIEDLMSSDAYLQGDTDDYIFATVIGDTVDAKAKLNTVYPNIMDLRIEGEEYIGFDDSDMMDIGDIRMSTPIDLFNVFFEKMNGHPMDGIQAKMLAEAMDEADGVRHR